jgi:hypothetical protein
VPRVRCTFRQRDLTRALRGAKAAGVDVAEVRVTKDGTIVIVPAQALTAAAEANEWDEVVLGGSHGAHQA